MQGKDGLVAEAQSRAVRPCWPQQFSRMAQQTRGRVPRTPEFLSFLSVEQGWLGSHPLSVLPIYTKNIERDCL